jgi:hypothetical protein
MEKLYAGEREMRAQVILDLLAHIGHGLVEDGGNKWNAAPAPCTRLGTSFDLVDTLASAILEGLGNVPLGHIITRADLCFVWSTNSQHVIK